MYQITVKCKGQRLVEMYEGENQTASGKAYQQAEVKEYTETSLQGSDNKVNFYFSCPIELLDQDMRIGDEVLVTFERKNK